MLRSDFNGQRQLPPIKPQTLPLFIHPLLPTLHIPPQKAIQLPILIPQTPTLPHHNLLPLFHRIRHILSKLLLAQHAPHQLRLTRHLIEQRLIHRPHLLPPLIPT